MTKLTEEEKLNFSKFVAQNLGHSGRAVQYADYCGKPLAPNLI